MAVTLTKDEKKQLKQHMKGDEISYSLGVMNVAFTSFILARWPQNYWIVHMVKSCFLLTSRYFRFKKQGWELYLLDFCYFATYVSCFCCVLCMVRIYLGKSSILTDYNYIFTRALFTLVNGPLAWSVLIFRNSLVFHDIDRTTSTFIHLSPALLSWAIRWGGGKGPSVVWSAWHDVSTKIPMFDICPGGLMSTEEGRATADACIHQVWCDVCGASWYDFLIPGIIGWSCWAVFYYVVVLVILRNWTKRNNKDTLYDHVMKTDPNVRLFVNLFPHSFKGMAYMFTHFFTTVTFGFLSVIFWHSFWIHTIFLLLMMFVSVKNGARFIFEYEMIRYTKIC